jgi:hypothetical protein
MLRCLALACTVILTQPAQAGLHTYRFGGQVESSVTKDYAANTPGAGVVNGTFDLLDVNTRFSGVLTYDDTLFAGVRSANSSTYLQNMQLEFQASGAGGNFKLHNDTPCLGVQRVDDNVIAIDPAKPLTFGKANDIVAFGTDSTISPCDYTITAVGSGYELTSITIFALDSEGKNGQSPDMISDTEAISALGAFESLADGVYVELVFAGTGNAATSNIACVVGRITAPLPSSDSNSNQVPEPPAVALLMLGLAAVRQSSTQLLRRMIPASILRSFSFLRKVLRFIPSKSAVRN